MTELQPMIRALQVAGIDPRPLQAPDIAHLVAHGHQIISRPLAASHRMRAEIALAPGARLHYLETHFHGHSGGMVVTPSAQIKLAEKAQMFADFSLVRVSASPLVRVSHPQAKVTHEAAVGSVDHQQLESLMAHGLSPDVAVDLIVSGILKTS